MRCCLISALLVYLLTAALVRSSKMRERYRTKSTNVIVHVSVTFLHTYFSTVKCCSHQKRLNCYITYYSSSVSSENDYNFNGRKYIVAK